MNTRLFPDKVNSPFSLWQTAARDVPAEDPYAMARLVMKFGGTSVADLDRIRRAADRIVAEVEAGHHVAVIVSAMAGETNKLVGLTGKAAALHDAREYDAVVASGEQVHRRPACHGAA